MGDLALHTGTKFRSVGIYFVFASPLGGAVHSCTFETKYIVLNVMHVELDAITQLANALMYSTHACQELSIVTPVTRRIYTDSEAAQSHCLNNSASKKSKHLEMRLQAVQDFQEDERIDVIHVAGGENCADQGTKSLDPETNLKHMIFILGHRMMPGKGIEGVQEFVPSEITPIRVAYLEAKAPGFVDVTENKLYRPVIEPDVCALCHVAYSAIVDVDALNASYAESISCNSSVLIDGESIVTPMVRDWENLFRIRMCGVICDIKSLPDGAGRYRRGRCRRSQSSSSDEYEDQKLKEILFLQEWRQTMGKELYLKYSKSWHKHHHHDSEQHKSLVKCMLQSIHLVSIYTSEMYWFGPRQITPENISLSTLNSASYSAWRRHLISFNSVLLDIQRIKVTGNYKRFQGLHGECYVRPLQFFQGQQCVDYREKVVEEVFAPQFEFFLQTSKISTKSNSNVTHTQLKLLQAKYKGLSIADTVSQIFMATDSSTISVEDFLTKLSAMSPTQACVSSVGGRF